MIWIYIASAIFGGAFVVPMVLGGMDFDTDIDLDFDTDVEVGELSGDLAGDLGDLGADADPGLDMAMDGDTFMSGVGDFVSSLLSFRSIVMAAAFFGLVGIVFTVLGTNSLAVLITAIALGLFAAVANTWVMQFVTKNQSTSIVTSRDMRGAQGEVVLPIGQDRKGRVRLQVAGQTEYFVALPYGDKHRDKTFEAGEQVVVVEIDKGTALVAPVQSLER